MTYNNEAHIAIDNELNWIWQNRLDDFSACQVRLTAVLAQSEALDYTLGICHSHVLKAQLLVYLGQFNEAIPLAKAALDALKSIETDLYAARALNVLGVAYMATSQLGEALQHYKQALVLCETNIDEEFHSVVLLNIGELYRGALNENEKALPFYLESLELSNASAHRWTPIIVAATALCLIRVGRVDEGRPLIEQSKSVLTEIKEARIKIGIYQLTAQSYKEMREFEQAIALIHLALADMDQPQYQYIRQNLYLIMAQALQEQGDSEQALVYCQKMLVENSGEDNNTLLLNLYKVMGAAYLKLELYEQGAHYLSMALTKMEKEISSHIERHTSVLIADMKYKTLEKDIEIHRLRNIELKEQAETLEMTAAELQAALEDLVQAQTQLVKTEKLAALGELVAGVSNEINTPLGLGITAASYVESNLKHIQSHIANETLTKQLLNTALEDSLDAIDVLNSNLAKAADTVTSFKQVAIDQSTYERRSFNVCEYINDTLVMMQPFLKLNLYQIEVDCDEHLEINSYPGAFYQIISQLILNAITHGFRNRTTGLIKIKIFTDQNHVYIRFSDNGHGIPIEDQPKIFDPFYTTNRAQGSLGLGLHSLYNLVYQMLNGTLLLVESRPGSTVFEVRFKAS